MPVAALRLLSTIATGLAIDVYGAAEAIGVETSSVEELGTTAARNGRLCSALSWDAFASQISGSESDICISIFREMVSATTVDDAKVCASKLLYQEQFRTLEVNNFTMAMNLRQTVKKLHVF
ncbi:hypothetical protein V6N11_029983 [Hibiscus sabdariffa]|uniref:Pectinesterase inhibitor domain-containing protein n=1 Tax=Hibiscus sabdariffa TaxID=183260 RepID=A0ABR2PJP4_9ROSI